MPRIHNFRTLCDILWQTTTAQLFFPIMLQVAILKYREKDAVFKGEDHRLAITAGTNQSR